METALSLSPEVGIRPACESLGISRATFYRKRKKTQTLDAVSNERRRHHRALSPEERQNVLDILHSDRFMDKAPHEVYATLLDEGIYYCSIRTMYRILDAHAEVKERRNQLRHPEYKKPELLATAPNQVWSWDITKLLGPAKWTYFYLYVIMDIFSRYVVGWLLAHGESATLAAELIKASCRRQGISQNQLTIHSDRGPAMRSKTLGELYDDLAIVRSHSRPHVSNDNPFSESQFKTMKYQPEFPARFGLIEDGRASCRR